MSCVTSSSASARVKQQMYNYSVDTEFNTLEISFITTSTFPLASHLFHIRDPDSLLLYRSGLWSVVISTEKLHTVARKHRIVEQGSFVAV